MKESLQALPQSLSELVQHSLSRLQSQYREVGLGWALAALTVSSTGESQGTSKPPYSQTASTVFFIFCVFKKKKKLFSL
jgi:hypothetical protein